MEREIVSQQRKSRKKLTNREIWDNVINNIVKFLSMSQNNKKVRKEELIAAMELPLAVCNCNIEELKEENAVLSDLLE